jgi:hypothetical protein
MELIAAVQETKHRIDRGNKWPKLRSLIWIWGDGLPELLAPQKGKPSNGSAKMEERLQAQMAQQKAAIMGRRIHA